MLQEHSHTPETFRSKFLSLPSKSQPKLAQINFLKSSRHSKESKVAKQIEEKVKQRYLPVLNAQKTFTTQKQEAQNDLFALEMVRNNLKLQTLLKKLHSTLIHSRIPEFYGFYFLKRLKDVNEKTFEDAINREINWIKERQCHYQLIDPTVKAREGCLKQLSQSLQNLQNNPSQDSAYREFREQITHYRRLTTLVIKQIKQWKDYLISLSENEFSDHPAFIYREEDYFLTLLNDNMFVFNSFLSKYVNFSQKNDPFFLRPHVNRFKQEKFSALFFVSQLEKEEYIGLLNYLAEQRARYLRKKVAIKSEKIREIEKVYHSRNHIEESKSQIFISNSKKSSSQDRMPYLQLKAQIDFVDDAQYESRKSQLKQKQRKLQNMRKIKQMIATSHGVTMVSKNKIDLINQTQSKISSPITTKTLLENPIKFQGTQTDYDEDFSRMMRKKQVQVLEEAKDIRQLKLRLRRPESNYANYGTPVIRMSRSSSFRTIKIKDSLSKQRRTLNNKSCLNQLESIVSTLQTTAPLELSRFKLNSKTSQEESVQQSPSSKVSPKKLKKLQHTPSLIKHNDEVIFNMRNRILKEIKSQQSGSLQIQMAKRLQSQRIQAILQQKIQKQVLRHVNEQKHKRTEGRQQMEIDYNKDELFGLDSRVQNSKKLTQLEQELKKQFQLRLLREVHSELKRKSQISDIELYKMQQQQKIMIEARKLAEKQEREKRFLEIQRQERAKAMSNLLELQEKRKKQLEKQMQRIIQQEKEKLQLFTLATSNKVKEQLKEQVKQNMLKQLQYEKDIYFQKKLTENEIKMRQEQYRQQVRKKLIQQYEIEEIVERQNQREEKERKQKMLEQKFQHFDQILEKSKPQAISQQNQKQLQFNESLIIQTHHQTLLMEQARAKILQQQLVPIQHSQIEKYKKVQQSEKLKMREQFEVQLFSFVKDQRLNMPQTQKPQKPFKIKDIQTITDDPQFLDKKQTQLKQQIDRIHSKQQQILQTNQKNYNKIQNQPHIQSQIPSQKQMQNVQSPVFKRTNKKQTESSAFQRFSESMTLQQLKNQVLSKSHQEQNLKFLDNKQQTDEVQTTPQVDEANRLKLGMTHEEYEMYKKKKRPINKNKKSDENQFKKQKFVKHKKTLKKVLNEFELVEFNQDSQEEDKNSQNKNYVDSIFDKGTRSEKEKNNQKKVFVFSNKSEAKPQTRGRSRRSRKSSFEKQAQDNLMGNTLIRDIKTEDNRQGNNFEDDESEVIKLTVHSHMDNPGFQRNNKFMTSEEEGGNEEGRVFRKRKSQRLGRTQNQFQNAKKNKSDQEKSSSQSQLETLIQQQIQARQQSRAKQTFVKVRQIKSQKLQEFMKDHFEHMPRLIKRLNLYKRDELVKILRQDYKCFTVLEFIENNVSLGLGIVGINQKKKGIRSFTIFHIGPYDQTDMLKLLKNFSQYLFKNDPVEQITLSLFYYSDIDEQIQFIKKFQKQFADHGVMFQKNIFDTQFERKLVMRRTLGQKGPEHKENVNYGCFWIQSDLVVANQFIGLQTGSISSAGHDFGIYGILSIYLAQYVSEQQLNDVIAQETKEQKIRHLAKQSLSFKPSKQKICDGESYKSNKFQSAFEMNLELHKLERPLIKCQSDLQDELIDCIWSNLRLDLELNYALTTQRLKFMYEDDEYWGDYLRFVPVKTSKKKTYTIKSKLYSSSITVMPCRNSRYKIFVLSSEEYDNIKKGEVLKQGEINLDIYIKLFFGNLSVHQIAEPQTIWLPQFRSKHEYVCRQIVEEFQPDSESTLKSSMEYYYTSYLENSLMYEASHRDLVITVPFILGVIDSQMQLVSEGACLVVKRFSIEDITGVKQVPRIIDQD